MKNIKLIGTEKEKLKAFQYIVTHGECSSYEKDIMLISDNVAEELKAWGFVFEEINSDKV